MAKKEFQGRIVNKHDLEVNWNLATNFIPLDGEIIIYDADINYNYPRIKIGNGIDKVRDLSFLPHWDAIDLESIDKINTAIEKLDQPDTAIDGKYVSAVSQENGIITVVRKDLPNISIPAITIKDSGDTDSTKETINVITDIVIDNTNNHQINYKNGVATTKKYVDDKLSASLEGLDSTLDAGNGYYWQKIVEENGTLIGEKEDGSGSIKVQIPTIPNITVKDGTATTPSTDTVSVVYDIDSSGHEITTDVYNNIVTSTGLTNKINTLDSVLDAGTGYYWEKIVEENGLLIGEKENGSVKKPLPTIPDITIQDNGDAATTGAIPVVSTIAIDATNKHKILYTNGSAATTNYVDTKVASAINALDATGVDGSQTDNTNTISFVDKISQTNGVISASLGSFKTKSNYHSTNNPIATINDIKNEFSGITGAMEFKGVLDTIPTNNTNYNNGDVIIVNNKDYIFNGTSWIELGDEGHLQQAINELDKKFDALDSTLDAGSGYAWQKIVEENGTLVGEKEDGSGSVKVPIPTLNWTDGAAETATTDTVDVVTTVTESGINGHTLTSTRYKAVTPKGLSNTIEALDATLDAGDGKYWKKIVQTNGVLDATNSVKGNLPVIPTIPTISVTNETATTPATATVAVVASTSANDHALTNTRVNVATAKGVTNAIEALDGSANAGSNYAIQSITETNGVISLGNKANLNISATNGTAGTATEETVDAVTSVSASHSDTNGDSITTTRYKVVTPAGLTNKINTLDSTLTASANYALSSITQTNGVLTSKTEIAVNNVTQDAAITTAGEYPIILSKSTATTAETNHVNKAGYLKYNPSSGNLTLSKTSGGLVLNNGTTTQANYPKISWGTIGSATPFIGYAADQSDGTFLLMSIAGGSSYRNGLAIGGSSGNLLWKGSVVATTDNINASIGALDKSDAPVNGQYVSAVSEANGIINVSRANLPITSLTLNGSSNTTPNFYAPTTVGTSGQILKSNGSGAPTWIDGASLIAPKKITLVATAGQTSFTIPFEYDSLSSNLTVYFNGILMKETDNYTVDTSNNTVNLAGFSAEAGDIITIMGLLGAQSIDFGQEAINAINEIDTKIASAKTEIDTKVASAKTEIDAKLQEAEDFITNNIPDDMSDYALVTQLNSLIQIGTTQPSSTSGCKLWIDTTSGNGNGLLKYSSDGTTWTKVSAIWS